MDNMKRYHDAWDEAERVYESMRDAYEANPSHEARVAMRDAERRLDLAVNAYNDAYDALHP